MCIKKIIDGETNEQTVINDSQLIKRYDIVINLTLVKFFFVDFRKRLLLIKGIYLPHSDRHAVFGEKVN